MIEKVVACGDLVGGLYPGEKGVANGFHRCAASLSGVSREYFKCDGCWLNL